MIIIILLIICILNSIHCSTTATIKLRCITSNQEISKSFIHHSSVYINSIPILWKCLFIKKDPLEKCLNFLANIYQNDRVEHNLFNYSSWSKLETIHGQKYFKRRREEFLNILEDQNEDELCHLIKINHNQRSTDETIETLMITKFIVKRNLLLIQSTELLQQSLTQNIHLPSRCFQVLLIHHELFIGLLLIIPIVSCGLVLLVLDEFS